jgi:hypothetical protein
MFQEKDFEDIRPYHDEEINPALRRIIAVPEFSRILEFLFPGKDKRQIIEVLENTYSRFDFQVRFMHPLVYAIVEKTSNGLTYDGFDQLTPGTPYLFVANHRDIVLDSAILQVILHDNKHETSEITFGSNLMINQFITDLGKVNRMFKVYRGGNKKELLQNSLLLSAYIRHTITEKCASIWIAQRNGRTKDGNDRTETGLLKMFNFSGSDNFTASFSKLNIVPLAVSYEYEPCCAAKVRELTTVSKGLVYQKSPGEDFKSILDGITRQKGHIHLSACTPVNRFIHLADRETGLNEKINKLATMIDAEIYKHYKLWPTNYIAWDILHNSDQFSGYYTVAEKEQFKRHMEATLSEITYEGEFQRELLLKIYANPLENAAKTGAL